MQILSSMVSLYFPVRLYGRFSDSRPPGPRSRVESIDSTESDFQALPRPPELVRTPKLPHEGIPVKIRRSRNFDPGDTRLPYMSWDTTQRLSGILDTFVFGHISGTIHPIGTSDRLKERSEISLSKLFERLISFAQKIDRKKKS